MKRLSLLVILAVLALSASIAAQPAPAPPAGSAKAAQPKAAQPKAAQPKAAQPKAADSADDAEPEAPADEAAADEAGLPAGHPAMDEPPAEGIPTPPGQMTREGFFRPAPDQIFVDKSLPAGTVRVVLVDAEGKRVPDAPITLHILHSSVTKGESRERLDVTADAEGAYVFRDRQYGSGISYQVKTRVGEATFASQPFGLRDDAGMTALLHVYDPVDDLGRAAIIIEGVVLLDIKEDNIALNHLLAVHNVGKQAFVTKGVTMPLPKEASAFQQQEAMGEQTVVERDGNLALVGTFPPGTTQLTYRYQVPLIGESTASLEVPMPPRVIATRVVVGASESMGMTVDGLPPAQKGRWHDGKRVLETSGRPAMSTMATLRDSTSPTLLRISITGIPTPGWGRWAATALALLVAAGGVFYFQQSHGKRALAADQLEDLREARARLLDEMAALERARLEGEVGPRTYERMRIAMIDALARIVAQLGGEIDEPSEVSDGDAADASGIAKRRKKRRKKRPLVAEV